MTEEYYIGTTKDVVGGGPGEGRTRAEPLAFNRLFARARGDGERQRERERRQSDATAGTTRAYTMVQASELGVANVRGGI